MISQKDKIELYECKMLTWISVQLLIRDPVTESFDSVRHFLEGL